MFNIRNLIDKYFNMWWKWVKKNVDSSEMGCKDIII